MNGKLKRCLQSRSFFAVSLRSRSRSWACPSGRNNSQTDLCVVSRSATSTSPSFSFMQKKRGKRPPPPDSSPAVTSTDRDPNPSKKLKLDAAPQSQFHRLVLIVCPLVFSLLTHLMAFRFRIPDKCTRSRRSWRSSVGQVTCVLYLPLTCPSGS